MISRIAVIAGGGPVGSLAAIALASQGWRVEVRVNVPDLTRDFRARLGNYSRLFWLPNKILFLACSTVIFTVSCRSCLPCTQVFEGRRQVTNGKPEADDNRAYNIGLTSRGVAAIEHFGVDTAPLAASHGGRISMAFECLSRKRQRSYCYQCLAQCM